MSSKEAKCFEIRIKQYDSDDWIEKIYTDEQEFYNAKRETRKIQVDTEKYENVEYNYFNTFEVQQLDICDCCNIKTFTGYQMEHGKMIFSHFGLTECYVCENHFCPDCIKDRDEAHNSYCEICKCK